MRNSLITEEILKDATGFKRRSALERYLRQKGIKFYVGSRGQIWTTVDAINQSLGLGASINHKHEEFEFAFDGHES